tara:strand:+ start:481 stop:756 length:276 start_codon:yes stop_codon:yes gene_type:complete
VGKEMSFDTGDLVQLWDYVLEGRGPLRRDDILEGHGEVGIILRRSRSTDVRNSNYPLREGAKDCYLVALPSGTDHVHECWLRKPAESKKNT